MPPLGLPLRPVITYGASSTVIALSMPQKWWGFKSRLIGGSRKSASGIPEAYKIREENLAPLVLRVHECELLQVRDWIMEVMGNPSVPFSFQFDVLDPYTTFQCYLEAPTFEDGFEPTRMTSPNFPQYWEFALTIRAVQPIPIFVGVTGNCGPTGLIPAEFTISGLDASALPNGAGRKILSLAPVPATWPPDGVTDPSIDTDFTPGGFPAAGILYTSIDPIAEWVTRKLSAGYVLPSVARIGGSTSGSPAIDWDLQDAVFVLSQIRGASTIVSYDSTVASFPWLGGGDYTSITFPGIVPFVTEDDDQFLLQAYSRYVPNGGGDTSGRLSLSWGAVPGPLETTKMYGYANVTELP
jgi:hypothetical protein